MNVKERAREAIHDLPDDVGFAEIIRELAFIAETDQAIAEIDEGKGLNATEAKQMLRECLTQ